MGDFTGESSKPECAVVTSITLAALGLAATAKPHHLLPFRTMTDGGPPGDGEGPELRRRHHAIAPILKEDPVRRVATSIN
uniref:Uncharacterized protein n=1 Tax=Knipowitschia caucasica TaxID=637954 RepID=A0AAV2J138_KNICA